MMFIGFIDRKMVSSFIEGWDLVQTLGEGAYGEVKLAVNTTTNEEVAVKFINLKKDIHARESVRKEIAIHKLLKHDNVIRFYGSRTAGDQQFMFLEYACGGELFDRIEPDVGMSPQLAQYYFRQLIEGLEYLHSRGVAHRDLKPENLLLDENDTLKISDFGFATVFRYQGEEREMEKCCGTLPYVAPEVIRRRPYSAQPADIWSCGIILVAMLAGELPWDEPSNECCEYSDWVKCCSLSSPWNKIENMALSLLRKILIENSKKRYTVPQMKKNQWFSKNLRKSMPIRLENLSGDSGTFKRRCSGLDQSSPSAVGKFDHQFSLSQPDVILRATESPSSAGDSLKALTYSQPVRPDHMMLSSQHQTQESQSSGPHLVRRLTRFFVKCNQEATVKELTKAFETLNYTWKKNSLGLFTIQTFDRRKCPLSFKAALVKMGENLLVDFRLSKGDGIQFKRNFTKIRDLLRPIISSQSAWPNASSVKELRNEEN
ncbi:serine/threonine-protein kinase Chk1-like [Octopus vulgaris]|uniref:non-specific serine/threonine protein kinase n=2 Tax=Octopus vulgaris TaxID=6645 RepID=A0AA36BP33_OCTVU|nr:serine/threonine-protein kinase Chk1-like [Octopus vulgaris]